MNIEMIEPGEKGIINVIIETPRRSQNKYDYDPKLNLFKLKKILPLGAFFPFDFGFIPNTLAEDGDPLDALVLMDEPAYPGCLVPCRPLGILIAEQQEQGGGKKIRNDRLITVSVASNIYGHMQELEQLGKEVIKGIEEFFVDYNKNENRIFTPVKWRGADKALKVLEKYRLG